jgi:hypothetical protein
MKRESLVVDCPGRSRIANVNTFKSQDRSPDVFFAAFRWKIIRLSPGKIFKSLIEDSLSVSNCSAQIEIAQHLV